MQNIRIVLQILAIWYNEASLPAFTLNWFCDIVR